MTISMVLRSGCCQTTTLQLLDATTAEYYLSEERLEAHRNVVATNGLPVHLALTPGEAYPSAEGRLVR